MVILNLHILNLWSPALPPSSVRGTEQERGLEKARTWSRRSSGWPSGSLLPGLSKTSNIKWCGLYLHVDDPRFTSLAQISSELQTSTSICPLCLRGLSTQHCPSQTPLWLAAPVMAPVMHNSFLPLWTSGAHTPDV